MLLLVRRAVNRVGSVERLQHADQLEVRPQWELVRVRVHEVLPLRSVHVSPLQQVVHTLQVGVEHCAAPHHIDLSRGEEHIRETGGDGAHTGVDRVWRGGVHVHAVEVLRAPNGAKEAFELAQIAVQEDAVRNRERELLLAGSGYKPFFVDE